MGRRVIVYHMGYGCDTGCCGHYVEIIDTDKTKEKEKFSFSHPNIDEDDITFAIRLVIEKFGTDHVEDLDWENCQIVND